VIFFQHRWQPFVGVGSVDSNSDGSAVQSKGLTLPPGNYEWPFSLLLNGDTTESIEGMREASVTYRLKATIARGKLMHDIHAYKQLRIIRTLEASTLEFLHAMSVENIWPNKIEYSIVAPQKAVVFGSSIPMEMRFTPLLKGLELGEITIRLIEVHDIILHTTNGHAVREHKKEREVDRWIIKVTREKYWRDMIDENGQEGWVVNTHLPLPKKLSKCLQDVNARGIKIRHKLKVVVELHNPDGHISELRATLPVTIFISPNMPLDEHGNLVRQLPLAHVSNQAESMAPPSYSEHMLDQLYEDIEPVPLHTPTGCLSGINSPLHGHSRTPSTENLAAVFHGTAISPALLTSRLQSMSLEQRHRNSSWNSNLSAAGGMSRHSTPPGSAPLTRHPSAEHHTPGSATPEHLEFPEIAELSKVPSYQTAIRTPARLTSSSDCAPPDYQTAVSTPASPQLHTAVTSPITDPLDPIAEAEVRPTPTQSTAQTPVACEQQQQEQQPPLSRSPSAESRMTQTVSHRRQLSLPFRFPTLLHLSGDGDESRRLHLLQARERLA